MPKNEGHRQHYTWPASLELCTSYYITLQHNVHCNFKSKDRQYINECASSKFWWMSCCQTHHCILKIIKKKLFYWPVSQNKIFIKYKTEMLRLVKTGIYLQSSFYIRPWTISEFNHISRQSLHWKILLDFCLLQSQQQKEACKVCYQNIKLIPTEKQHFSVAHWHRAR